MKESIGGTQLFLIVVFMIVLFASIMGFTINRSNAFAIKNKIVGAIEDNDGLDLRSQVNGSCDAYGLTQDEKTLCNIVQTFRDYNYVATGKCPEGYSGYSRSGKISSTDAAFCIMKEKVAGKNGTIPRYTYRVVLFYAIDLPVVNQMFHFRANGQTKTLFN